MKKVALTIVAMMIASTALALWAGKVTSTGVEIVPNKKTPLAAGWYTKGAYTNRNVAERYLKVVDGAIVQKTVEEKAAADAAAAAKAAAELAAWNNAKTNHADVVMLDNRFMEILGYANMYLMGEGIITNALTPANVTEDRMAFYLVSMTNQTVAAGLSSRLDTVLRYDTKATADAIGMPPDGSTVMSNISTHH